MRHSSPFSPDLLVPETAAYMHFSTSVRSYPISIPFQSEVVVLTVQWSRPGSRIKTKFLMRYIIRLRGKLIKIATLPSSIDLFQQLQKRRRANGILPRGKLQCGRPSNLPFGVV